MVVGNEEECTGGLNISMEQLRTLLEGLCVWNCPALDLLTDRGREKLHKAQDLIERLWNEARI